MSWVCRVTFKTSRFWDLLLSKGVQQTSLSSLSQQIDFDWFNIPGLFPVGFFFLVFSLIGQPPTFQPRKKKTLGDPHLPGLSMLDGQGGPVAPLPNSEEEPKPGSRAGAHAKVGSSRILKIDSLMFEGSFFRRWRCGKSMILGNYG